jgi:hypothetical protein
MIDNNLDELHNLLKANGTITASKDLTEYNWSTRGHRYRTPDDVLIPVSLSCTVTRTEVYPMSAQNIFAEFVSRRQAEKIVSNTANKVMYPKPIVVWEDPYYLMLIGDAYTTSLVAGVLTYLRKPYKLDFSYTELAGVGTGSLSITAITNASYFLSRSRLTYVDSGGTPVTYKAGEKILKVAGYNTISYSDEPIVVGYPWGYTNTPDFPAHLHDMFVDLAVSLFLEEAKFKLIPKN